MNCRWLLPSGLMPSKCNKLLRKIKFILKCKCFFVSLCCISTICYFDCTSIVSSNKTFNSVSSRHAFLTKDQYEVFKKSKESLEIKSFRKKVVILFSNKRSGSSFVGEFFNTNRNAFYLFEPLFPFTRDCDFLQTEKLSALRQFIECNFQDVKKIYRKAFNVSNHTDWYAKCTENTLCFLDRHGPLLKQYHSECFSSNNHSKEISLTDTPESEDCKVPLKTSIISRICSKSRLVVFKVLRICQLQSLQGMLEEMNEKRTVELKIIHLVRDPRAILLSRMMIDKDDTSSDTLGESAASLCRRMEKNLEFANSYWKDNGKGNSFYLRIRHEYAASHPEKAAETMYKFIGQELPDEVKIWLKDTSINETQSLHLPVNDAPFGVRKKVKEVINRWRHILTFKEVNNIQLHCANVIKKMNYLMVTSRKDFRRDTELFSF